MKRNYQYQGWATWHDWGSAFRWWKLQDDFPELNASKGNGLYDRGPQYGEVRFSLRHQDDGARLGEPKPELVAETLFLGVLPPWRPPRPGEIAIINALDGIRDELKIVNYLDLTAAFEPDEEIAPKTTNAEPRADDPVMKALRRFMPDGPRRLHTERGPNGRYRSWYTGSALDCRVFYATETIEGTRIRQCDFLLDRGVSRKLNGKERASIRGAALLQMPRSMYPALAEHTGSLRFLEGGHERWESTATFRLRSYLTRPMVLKAADDTSPIYILRGLRSPVSTPIEATSDEVALFDLITDSGGTMPGGGASR